MEKEKKSITISNFGQATDISVFTRSHSLKLTNILVFSSLEEVRSVSGELITVIEAKKILPDLANSFYC